MKSFPVFFIIVVLFATSIFSQTPGTLKWEYQYYGGTVTSPAIGGDGTIYTAVDSMVIHAINPDGTKKWDFETPGPQAFFAPPVVGNDGTIYVISDKLYALNPDSTLKWDFFAGGDGITLGNNGTIYTSYNDYWIGGKIYAINPNGTQKWLFESTNLVSAPVVGTDGTIYFASNKKLFALNPDKTEKWRYQANTKIISSPVIGSNGIMYMILQDGLLGVNPDGTKKWKIGCNTDNNSSLSIDLIGNIYFTTNGYKLNAFKSNGQYKWAFLSDSTYFSLESSTPAIGSDGIIYAGLANKLYAIDSTGNHIWEFVSAAEIASSSPAIANDGTIYFRSWGEGKLYAVYSSSLGLANSSWPKLGKNNQNQASIFDENCPVAKVANDSISISNGGNVTLDGSPSYDPDGDPFSYLWRVMEMPPNNPIYLTDSTSAIISVNIPGGQVADYRFSLMVTDNDDGDSWTPVTVSTGKKWVLDGQACSPAIGSDSLIYTANSAINPDGTIEFSYTVNGRYVALGPDSTIYVASQTDWFYALNPDGTIKWQIETIETNTPPAIVGDSLIYLASYNYDEAKVYAINSDGSIKWEFDSRSEVIPPVVSHDGTVYFCTNGKLFALKPDGKKIWDIDIGTNPEIPAIDLDGTIYIHSQGIFYAIHPDGTKKWELPVGSYSSSPVIDNNGVIYLGSDNFYAVNSNGTLKWQFAATSGFVSTPAIGSDGIIYAGSQDSTFYAINPDGTEKWSFKTGKKANYSPAIGFDGSVYFGANDGKLNAVYTESYGLINSSWPKHQKNNYNSASSYNENCPQARVVEDYISLPSGGQVTLDGSPSFDPDGDPLNYLWRIAEKPQGSTVILTDSTSSVITVNIPITEHAKYRFALTVADNDDGYSSESVIVNTALKWEFDTGNFGENLSPPAIANDGTIYISGEQNLYAVNPDGSLKWQFPGNGQAYTAFSPAINPQGTVYFATGNELYAVNSDGTELWSLDTLGIASAPAIASDGTVYIIDLRRIGWGFFSFLNAFNPDKTKKWETQLTFIGSFSISIGNDETIFVSSRSGWYNDIISLQAIDANGGYKWNNFVGLGTKLTSPAIALDGTIYTSSDTLFAFNTDSTVKWEFYGNSSFNSSPAIDTDGTIYLGSSDSTFYAVNPNGTEKWHIQLGSYYWSAPAIGADGTIFIASDNDYEIGKFYAINPNGTLKWEYETGDFLTSSPAIASDGTIYFGTNDGKLSAAYSNCGGLANSSWSKYAHDNQNTGNINTLTLIENKENVIPKSYSLKQNYPNPFNPTTTIEFSIPESEFVNLKIYNVLGQEVATLVSEKLKPGNYKYTWDASAFASGVYFYRLAIHSDKLESTDFVKSNKLILMK